jgi:uncharacterized ParB-like nuclease family protein
MQLILLVVVVEVVMVVTMIAPVHSIRAPLQTIAMVAAESSRTGTSTCTLLENVGNGGSPTPWAVLWLKEEARTSAHTTFPHTHS